MNIKLTANKTYVNGEETVGRTGRGASVKDREGLALALKTLILKEH